MPRKQIKYVVDENGCHICTSHRRTITINGKVESIHNYVYRTQVGEIPEGMIVTRTCGNNKCINSDHLTLTTRGDLNKKSQYHPIEYEIDENGCHVCTSHPSGVIRINGKSEYIRRVIYREHFGEIGEDKYIYQVCGNNRCINPDHLKIGNRGWKKRKPIEYYVNENGCHVCTSHKERYRMNFNGKRITFLQYVYTTQVGEIPEGKNVVRKCGNIDCINPDHLILTTKKELLATTHDNPIEYEVDEDSGCHICTSHKSKNLDGKRINIYKYVYITQVGEIPEGMFVTHKCGNNKCINPDHLRLTTWLELQADISKKYRAKPIDFDIDPVTGCFNCTSHPLSAGRYHSIKINGKSQKVHRFVYEQMFGEIPEGLEVCHKCDNTHCINPEHLELGTHDDNMRQMAERGRSRRGEKSHFAKLTEDDVREIKRKLAAGEKVAKLVREYGISNRQIYSIKNGKSWKHVD